MEDIKNLINEYSLISGPIVPLAIAIHAGVLAIPAGSAVSIPLQIVVFTIQGAMFINYAVTYHKELCAIQEMAEIGQDKPCGIISEPLLMRGKIMNDLDGSHITDKSLVEGHSNSEFFYEQFWDQYKSS